jgi:hypothetical protein
MWLRIPSHHSSLFNWPRRKKQLKIYSQKIRDFGLCISDENIPSKSFQRSFSQVLIDNHLLKTTTITEEWKNEIFLLARANAYWGQTRKYAYIYMYRDNERGVRERKEDLYGDAHTFTYVHQSSINRKTKSTSQNNICMRAQEFWHRNSDALTSTVKA